MKIRTDFVTNSSSTSYCIVGLPNEDLLKLWKEGEDEDAEDSKYEFLEKDGIDEGHIYEIEIGATGLDISKMKDNETLLQFKTRALDALKKAFPTLKACVEDINIHVDGGMDS